MSQISSTAGKVQSDQGWSRSFDGWIRAMGESIRSIKHRVRLWYFAVAAKTLAKLWIPDNSNAKVIIIPDCFGRLANRLTVLANVLAYAKDNNAIVLDLSLRQALKADCFDSSNKIAGGLLFAEIPPRRTPIAGLLIRVLRRSAKEVERLSFQQPGKRFHGIPLLRGDLDRVDLQQISKSQPRDRCIVLTGILLDAVPPSHSVCEEIRALFPPNVQARSFVNRTFEAVENEGVTVGVHVRHGDYREWQEGRYFHPFGEYVQCMKVIQDSLPSSPTFMVVSDAEQDMSLCGGSLQTRRVYGSEEQDLALLAQCDFIIATHSSFANWASFLGRVPILTVRDGLKLASESSKSVHDKLDLNELNVVEFPTLQSDYII